MEKRRTQGKRKDQKNGVSIATTNRDLCRLKNVFSKAVDWDYLDQNQAAGIQQESEAMEPGEYLSQEEVAKVLEKCEDRVRPLLMKAVCTGMRWGELMNLEWRDTGFEKRLITVRKPKNSDTRYIPMDLNPELPEIRGAHQKEQAREADGILPLVFANSETSKAFTDLRKPFFKALRDAKITRRFTCHGFRHTAASHMAMAGIDLYDVGAILGHKDPKMTRRYAHLSPEYLKRLSGRLLAAK